MTLHKVKILKMIMVILVMMSVRVKFKLAIEIAPLKYLKDDRSDPGEDELDDEC